MANRIEYIDCWLFNRGQQITLWKGRKYWRVSVQLLNTTKGYPFKYLRDTDKERVLLRALKLIKADVAKDGQEVEYLDQYKEHGSNTLPFPVKVHTETETMDKWINSPQMQKLVGEMRTDITLRGIEFRSYPERP